MPRAKTRAPRRATSPTRSAIAERTLEREEPRIEEAQAEVEDLRRNAEEAEEGSFSEKLAERRLERAERTISGGEERLAEARASLEENAAALDAARGARGFWSDVSGVAFYLLMAGVVIDALLLPGLVRRANAQLPDEPLEARPAEGENGLERPEEDADRVENWIDRLSLFCGEFAAYWAVIAVFVYYFEVIARYVFNSPTNWAHEAMYLMFGMQYLIAGAYAMLTESHVRVDIFYAPLSRRRKAWVDLLTSVFFFIFAGHAAGHLVDLRHGRARRAHGQRARQPVGARPDRALGDLAGWELIHGPIPTSAGARSASTSGRCRSGR